MQQTSSKSSSSPSNLVLKSACQSLGSWHICFAWTLKATFFPCPFVTMLFHYKLKITGFSSRPSLSKQDYWLKLNMNNMKTKFLKKCKSIFLSNKNYHAEYTANYNAVHPCQFFLYFHCQQIILSRVKYLQIPLILLRDEKLQVSICKK